MPEDSGKRAKNVLAKSFFSLSFFSRAKSNLDWIGDKQSQLETLHILVQREDG